MIRPLLFITLFTSVNSFGAKLLYHQDFETPLAEIPEFTQSKAITLVKDSPKSGQWSARGNFNSSITDPITKSVGQPNPGWDVKFDRIPALKDWFAKTEKIYVSWWFKLDACHWRGPEFSNNDPLKASAKFAYMNMNHNPATSYYLSTGGGAMGEGILQSNSGAWMDEWVSRYGKVSIYTATGSSYGTDGKWHKLSFFIGKDNGQKYIQWWVDDKLMRAEEIQPDGKFRINNSYIMNSIGFWHTAQGKVSQSTVKESGNHCNGWQIDSFQVWDDIPARPLPPNT